MSWFNYYGLIAIAIILTPNIILSIKDKTYFENKFNNKVFLVLEQIGRYGCMIFMVFNIPYTYLGFWFDYALPVYLAVCGTLPAVYIVGWIFLWKGKSLIKALLLSITPTLLFLFSGIIISSSPLIFVSVLFGVCHITISCKNAD